MDSNEVSSPAPSPGAGVEQLTGDEARVLGVLIEKAALVPDSYPLTANAVQLGANQKTSREPLLELSIAAVGHALRSLEDRRMVRVVHGARALRYEHRTDEALRITPKQRAVIAMLMLRGAQTSSELLARTERMATFAGSDDLRDTLERLCTRTPPLALRIAKGPGQREERYAHLLCGTDVAAHANSAAHDRRRETPGNTLEERLAALEARVDALEAQSAAG